MRCLNLFIFIFFIFCLNCASSKPDVSLVEVKKITQGTLLTLNSEGKKLIFPLKHTEVKAEISGYVAQVKVIQEFENPFDKPIEAVYKFPLPENAAVNEMLMKIGKRMIRGEIKRRQRARQIYEQAKAEGKTASLLEQERPNIFTQSIANILPGDIIRIEIQFLLDLKYDKGKYEFVFPMTVAPRYIPGDSTGKTGDGWAADTDRVPDASHITPTVLPPELRSGHDISLTVDLNAGVPIQKLESPSHKIKITDQAKNSAKIVIDSADKIPNKDFILRYKVAGNTPEVAVLTHRDGKNGYFMLMVQPKSKIKPSEITPKEMVFVVDNSGSMNGFPIEKVKEIMRKCINGMNPNDAFQIIHFSNTVTFLSAEPLQNTRGNIQKGLTLVEQFTGEGGTEMLDGIKAVLNIPQDPKRLRIILFLTDGLIGNEDEILNEIQKNQKTIRIFPVGIGSSPNHYLIERIAEEGRGYVQYVRSDENPDEVIQTFYERISNPFLTDIEFDWKNLEVQEPFPGTIPDLFTEQPLIILGRYDQPGKAEIELTGKIAGEVINIPIKAEFPEQKSENKALVTLWARKKIEKLSRENYGLETPEIAEKLTRLALQYQLMSKYTSFVAVEETVRNEVGKQETVNIPVELPEDMDYAHVFGTHNPVPQSIQSYGLVPQNQVGTDGVIDLLSALDNIGPLLPGVGLIEGVGFDDLIEVRRDTQVLKSEPPRIQIKMRLAISHNTKLQPNDIDLIINWMEKNPIIFSGILKMFMGYSQRDLISEVQFTDNTSFYLLAKKNLKQLTVMRVDFNKNEYILIKDIGFIDDKGYFITGIFMASANKDKFLYFEGTVNNAMPTQINQFKNEFLVWVESIRPGFQP